MTTSKMENAVIPLMPIWDAINDLSRLRGIVAAVAYLTSPQHLKEDDDFEIFHDVFMDVAERLDAATYALDKARQNIKFVNTEGYLFKEQAS